MRGVGIREYSADLHVHTALSPCGENEMTPTQIVRRAREVGISLLAITDHNSAANAPAVMVAGRRAGIGVLPGLEISSREEVHVLCLFDSVTQALDMQALVYRCLPSDKNREDYFGTQLCLDEDDREVGRSDLLLIGATCLPLEAVVAETRARGGVCIPSHVESPSFGLLGVLGTVPANLNVDAYEISRRSEPSSIIRDYPALSGCALISSSDAHSLEEIATPRLRLVLGGAPSARELIMAFRQQGGRRVLFEACFENTGWN